MLRIVCENPDRPAQIIRAYALMGLPGLWVCKFTRTVPEVALLIAPIIAACGIAVLIRYYVRAFIDWQRSVLIVSVINGFAYAVLFGVGGMAATSVNLVAGISLGVVGLIGSYGLAMLVAVLVGPALNACRLFATADRCIECGYDLAGNTTGRCPECGNTCRTAIGKPDGGAETDNP